MTLVFRHIPLIASLRFASALSVKIRQSATYGEHAYTYHKNSIHGSNVGLVCTSFKKGAAKC